MNCTNKGHIFPEKYGSSAKCVDAFHIALTEKPKLLIKQNIAKTVNYLFFYHPLTLKTFSF